MGFNPALELCDFEVAEVVVAGDDLEVAEEGFGASLEVALCGAWAIAPTKPEGAWRVGYASGLTCGVL